MKTAKEGKITAIEPQQRDRNRVSVFLDGEFAMGVHTDVAASLFLGVGQRITPERLEQIVREETLAKAKDRAFLFLSYRARSESEVRQRLAKAGYEADIVDEVVAKLYGLGYLNDQDFAEKFVSHRLAAKPVGRRALTWELRRKGLDAQTVDEATARVDDDSEREACLTAARGRAGKISMEQPREARQKLAAFLQRRGFGWDTIKSVLDDVLSPEDDA